MRRLLLVLVCLATLHAVGCAPSNESGGDVTSDDAGTEGDAPIDDAVIGDVVSGEDVSPDAPDVANDDADSDATADATDAGSEPAPSIGAALDCRIGEPPNRSVSPGTDLMRVTLTDPDAVCNDGSPGVVYVRPGSGANADRWVVWLEGGGGCTSSANCAERWCGDRVPTTAAKMSSQWAPQGIVGTGIFDRAPRRAVNRFADWSHAVVYYCSSDGWTGERDHDRLVDATGAWPDYSIRFRGRAILDAAVEALRTGAISDDGQVAMPSLDDATQVLWTGTSAGGAGARLNADRVFDTLREANPDVDLRLVVDAGFVPRLAGGVLTDEDLAAFYEGSLEVATGLWGSTSDASCLDAHSDDVAFCFDSTHVLLHHVVARTFLKMDVSDSVNSPGVYPDDEAFEAAVRDTLAELADGTFVHEEPDVMPPEVIFAPDCRHHVALESSEFFDIALEDESGAVSFHDALAAWADDDVVGAYIDGDGVAPASTCEPPRTTPWPTTPGRHDVVLDVDGVSRRAHVVVPTGFEPDTPSPSLLVFHGASGQARGFADDLTELRRLADARGWLLVFAQGLDNVLGTSSWAWSTEPNVDEWPDDVPDDIGYVLALVQAARDHLGADPNAVHLAGFSKGGRMVHRVAAEYPARFRGIAVVASSTGATIGDDPEFYVTGTPSGSVAALLVHGTDDPLLPIEGSDDLTAFSAGVESWRVANGCEARADRETIGPALVADYAGCSAPTRAIEVTGLRHQWTENGAAVGFSMSAEVMAFFADD